MGCNIEIASGAKVQKNVIICNNVKVGRQTKIENSVEIAPNVRIADSVMIHENVKIFQHAIIRSCAILDKNVWVEANVIIEYVSFVGQGSLVRRNVPRRAVIYGPVELMPTDIIEDEDIVIPHPSSFELYEQCYNFDIKKPAYEHE